MKSTSHVAAGLAPENSLTIYEKQGTSVACTNVARSCGIGQVPHMLQHIQVHATV